MNGTTAARTIRHGIQHRSRDGLRRSLRRGVARWLAAAGAAFAIAGAPLGAVATPIVIGGAGGPSLSVDPLYFQGFNVFGLTGPGTGANYFSSAPQTFLSAGNAPGMQLSVSQNLQLPVWQNPQNPSNSLNPGTNGGVPTAPTTSLPAVADSRWTVRNDAGRTLEDVLLLFTRTRAINGYPEVDAALDDNLISVLEYTSNGTQYYYGAMLLGDLAPGQAVDILVRYIVADPLPLQDGNLVLPSLGLAGLEKGQYVPEPGTLALVALGVAAIAGRRRM